MPPDELARRFANFDRETAPTVAKAIERALTLASPRDMIFVGGSNFVVGEALATLDC